MILKDIVENRTGNIIYLQRITLWIKISDFLAVIETLKCVFLKMTFLDIVSSSSKPSKLFSVRVFHEKVKEIAEWLWYRVCLGHEKS